MRLKPARTEKFQAKALKSIAKRLKKKKVSPDAIILLKQIPQAVPLEIENGVLDRLRTQDEKLLIELEKKFFAKLSFRPEPTYGNEQWAIFNAMNNQELAKNQN